MLDIKGRTYLKINKFDNDKKNNIKNKPQNINKAR